MELLLPAFKAGLHVLAIRAGLAEAISESTENVELSAAVFDKNGRELHRTSALRALIAMDPEASEVAWGLRSLAASLARSRFSAMGRLATSPASSAIQELATSLASYRLRGAFVGLKAVGLSECILITVERLDPMLPGPAEVASRYGLTRRQSEVALLMAQGLSNRAIGEQLGISPHTVRHHSEAIFGKLGVRSRTAIGLVLLGRGPVLGG